MLFSSILVSLIQAFTAIQEIPWWLQVCAEILKVRARQIERKKKICVSTFKPRNQNVPRIMLGFYQSLMKQNQNK